MDHTCDKSTTFGSARVVALGRWRLASKWRPVRGDTVLRTWTGRSRRRGGQGRAGVACTARRRAGTYGARGGRCYHRAGGGSIVTRRLRRQRPSPFPFSSPDAPRTRARTCAHHSLHTHARTHCIAAAASLLRLSLSSQQSCTDRPIRRIVVAVFLTFVRWTSYYYYH